MGLLSQRSEGDDEHEEVSIAGLEHLEGGGSGDECVFDLSEWSARGVALVRERLELFGVPHTWEDDTSLVVAAADEAWAERVLDQAEADLSLDLDPDVTQIAYDLTDWDAATREQLLDGLEDEAIPHGVDGDELFVHEIDEERVDELVDSIVTPGAVGATAGGDAAEVMGALFVAADRLVHDPNEHGAVLALIDAIRLAEEAPVPYGMDKVWWDDVQAKAESLTALLDVNDVDDEAVAALATELRDGLRPYV